MAERSIRACLITNPRAGRGGVDLSEAIAVLQARGWTLTVQQKLRGGQATELARAAAEAGYDVVVGCAGDGTLREIVNGLVGTDAAFGVLPGGTVNLWAQEIGISRRLRVAATQLANAQRRWIDVGHLTVNGKHGRYFLLMAGLGFDGAVMARVSKPLKNRIGRLAVGIATLESLGSFRMVPVRAELDGVRWQGRVSQVVVGNTRRYAGFTRITAGAYLDDGLLDVCLITADGPFSAGRQLSSLLFQQRPDPQTAELYRVGAFTLRSPVPLPMQLDGGAARLKKLTPGPDGMVYRFTAVAQGVCALVPSTYDGALFMREPAREPLLHAGQTTVRPPALPHGPASALPALPPASEPASADRQGKADPQGKKGVLRISGVGPDYFHGARPKSGKVWTVLLDGEAQFVDAHGHRQPLHEALPALRADMLVQVTGKKDRENRTIAAQKIRLLPPA